MRKALVAIVGIIAMSGLVAAQDAKKVDAGKQIFAAQKCSTCHKVDGVGGKLASELNGVGTKKTEAEIRKWLTNPAELEAKLSPKPKMPMSGFLKTHKLSDSDVDALTAYMLSLKK